METLMTMEMWRSYTHLNCKLILPFMDLSRARWSHRHILCIYFSFLTPLNITVSPPLGDLVFSTDSSHFVPFIINGMKSSYQRKPHSVLFDSLQIFCLSKKKSCSVLWVHSTSSEITSSTSQKLLWGLWTHHTLLCEIVAHLGHILLLLQIGAAATRLKCLVLFNGQSVYPPFTFQ